jgi:hypothetical protein
VGGSFEWFITFTGDIVGGNVPLLELDSSGIVSNDLYAVVSSTTEGSEVYRAPALVVA